MGSGTYFYPGGALRGTFLNLSGGTVTGDTIFTRGLTATTRIQALSFDIGININGPTRIEGTSDMYISSSNNGFSNIIMRPAYFEVGRFTSAGYRGDAISGTTISADTIVARRTTTGEVGYFENRSIFNAGRPPLIVSDGNSTIGIGFGISHTTTGIYNDGNIMFLASNTQGPGGGVYVTELHTYGKSVFNSVKNDSAYASLDIESDSVYPTLRIRSGNTPSVILDGSIWNDGVNLLGKISGVTQVLNTAVPANLIPFGNSAGSGLTSSSSLYYNDLSNAKYVVINNGLLVGRMNGTYYGLQSDNVALYSQNSNGYFQVNGNGSINAYAPQGFVNSDLLRSTSMSATTLSATSILTSAFRVGNIAYSTGDLLYGGAGQQSFLQIASSIAQLGHFNTRTVWNNGYITNSINNFETQRQTGLLTTINTNVLITGTTTFGSLSARTLSAETMYVGPSSTSNAALRIRAGNNVNTPNDGDIWKESTGLKFYDGQTKTLIGSNVIRVGVNYTATTKDFGGFINVTGTTGVIITLPNPTTVNTGVPLYVKDAGFSAATNNITVIPNSISFTIDGLSAYTLNQRAQIVGFYSDGLQYYIN